MGKSRTKDRMYLSATEWQRDFGGHKGPASSGDFRRLELDCCSLSFLPFEHPVCSPAGHIFDLENIVPYVQRYHRNPVTDESLELSDLIKLNFARNEAGDLHCPVTFKAFTEHTHVVALKTTGNVYSYEAVDTLCLKAKSMLDLLDNTPFTRADIITLQDPHNILARNPNNFAHIKDEKVAKQVDTLKAGSGSGAAAAGASASASSAAAAAAPAASPAAAASAAPARGRPRPSLGISLAPKADGASAAAAALGSGPARAMYSSGAVSGSFTSTSMSVATQNERQVLSADQILQQRYDDLRKRKAKGYVRLHTTLGHINLELHADLVPRTCHNFMQHCENGYYKDTKFHRVIPGFMIQGGDPDGTGRGGEGAFEREFKDEFHSQLRHDSRGVLAMANSGPNTNGSQFYLTLSECPHLDNKHSVFGRVVGGMEVLDAIEKVDTVKGKNEAKPKDCPVKDILITNVTVYDNPFKGEFVPHDELTRKKENEQAPVEETSEMGKWFSNPQAQALKPVTADGQFKYLPVTKSTGGDAAALKQKRKGSPTAADDASGGASHPAFRAAAAASASSSVSTPGGSGAMDTTQTPKAGTEDDEVAREFEAARRRQQLKQQQAAAQKGNTGASSTYGNFSGF